MIRGLAVTHGELGAALVEAVSVVYGPVEQLGSLSNRGQSAPDLASAVVGWLDDPGAERADGAVLFVDDRAGSCASAALLACDGRQQIAVLSGVNLAMLLGFVSWRQSTSFTELIPRLIERGRDAVAEIDLNGRSSSPR